MSAKTRTESGDPKLFAFGEDAALLEHSLRRCQEGAHYWGAYGHEVDADWFTDESDLPRLLSLGVGQRMTDSDGFTWERVL